MIFVREIRKSFGRVEAVRGVSFAVEPGEIVGLLGPNGAGKSTTIRVIAGYLTPDGGAVQIDGFDTQTHSLQARRRIGYLPESAPVYPEMSVAGYLDYRARLFGLDRAARRKALGTALDRCRIADVARRRVGDLSKGYKQRVGLASALLHDPPVLILDEPSNGLDPSQIRETRSLVKDLAEKRTMIVSSHILPEVERLATRLVVIAGGRKRADGDLRDLLSRQTTRTLVAEVQDHTGAFTTTVGATRGVQRVGRSDADAPGWVRLTIEVLPSAPDPRPEIARQAAAAGVALRELREERPSIERLFLELVESGDGQAGPA
ncbi:MAG: ABC transporter ATP-binding protein [Phycisphaerales bacterium]|nr:ABC transporter ATP-binding protein [Phycisphaerales bacterium]